MPGWVDSGGLKLMLAQPGWISDSYPINKDVVLKPAVNSEYVLNTKDEQSLGQLEGFFPSGTAREVHNEECGAVVFKPWPPLQ